MIIIWLLQAKYFILTKKQEISTRFYHFFHFYQVTIPPSFPLNMIMILLSSLTTLTSLMFHASLTLFCIEIQHISLHTTLIPSSLSCLPYSLLCIYKAYITLHKILTSFLSCLPYCLLRIYAAYITAYNFYLLIFILPPLLSYVYIFSPYHFAYNFNLYFFRVECSYPWLLHNFKRLPIGREWVAPAKWDHMRGRCFGTQYPKDARHCLLLLRTGSSKITFKPSLDGSTPGVSSIFSACGDLDKLYRLYRKWMQLKWTL